jgi:methionine synthase II (cobalamin-independent)
LKGQITGPISFAFTVSDEDGVPLFFDKELCEAAVTTLSLRAQWQATKLKNIFKDIIIFIDEPSLVFFKQTASDSKIKKEELTGYINRLIAAIHTEACYAGLHCCGDADWDFILSTDVDILSIDAYNYGDSFVKSYRKISTFLDRGGIIAWGIVPTASKALKDDVNTLIAKLETYIRSLSEKDIDRQKIIKSSLITPSCGCGILTEQETEDTISKCVKFSQLAKERIT